MAGTAQFAIGAEACCSDGACGELTRVIVDPVAEAVTHLVCTPAEFGKLDSAEETQFIPGTISYAATSPAR